MLKLAIFDDVSVSNFVLLFGFGGEISCAQALDDSVFVDLVLLEFDEQMDGFGEGVLNVGNGVLSGENDPDSLNEFG